jgi:hypothetical protein
MLIIELIGAMCLAFFIAKSNAVEWLKEYLAAKKIYYNKDRFMEDVPPYVYVANLKPLDCPKCLSFWLCLTVCLLNGLLIYQTVLIAMVCYTLAKVYSK